LSKVELILSNFWFSANNIRLFIPFENDSSIKAIRKGGNERNRNPPHPLVGETGTKCPHVDKISSSARAYRM
jgi:hypothetical protein